MVCFYVLTAKNVKMSKGDRPGGRSFKLTQQVWLFLIETSFFLLQTQTQRP